MIIWLKDIAFIGIYLDLLCNWTIVSLYKYFMSWGK